MVMDRFFDLQTATDLLRKLAHDAAALQRDSENVYLAYNFFVTAENMPEWVNGGGRRGKAFKHKIQQQALILTLVNELATGAKHMTSDKQKPAIASATRARYVAEGYVQPGYCKEPLVVRLSPEQAATRGQDTIDVLSLAGEVLAYRQRYLQAPTP